MHNRLIVPLAVLIVVAIVALAPGYIQLITVLGCNIPYGDVPLDYALGLFWSLALGAGILLWPVSAADKRALLVAWLAKILVTLVFMPFYESVYSLDAFGYFRQSRDGGLQLSSFSFSEGTDNLNSLAKLHHLLFPDSYHAMKVSFAMIGLIGIYFFYRAGVLFIRREDRRMLYLLAFFPGILFWSSILGKDPVVFLGIAMYCFGVVGWFRSRQLRFFAVLLLGVCIASFIRPWLGIIMLFPLGIILWSGIRGLLTKAVFTLVIAAALVLSVGPLTVRFKIDAVSDVLTTADKTTKGFVSTAGGSTQQVNVDLTSLQGMATFLPYAGFTALFRPFPGEVRNAFGVLAGAESALLLWLLFLSIKRTRLRELKEPLVLWAVTFLVVWALLNGIVSSVNFGVAVRYKLQVLPLLLGVLFYLSRNRALKPAQAPLPLTSGGTRIGSR